MAKMMTQTNTNTTEAAAREGARATRRGVRRWWGWALAPLLPLGLGLVGCGAEPVEEVEVLQTPVAPGEEATAGEDSAAQSFTSGTQVRLYYEGTCGFLACNSRYARRHARADAGTYTCRGKSGYYAPSFFCKPDDTGCSDSERWLAVPRVSSSQCGREYLVCLGGRAVRATVKDRSDAHQLWEASPGLLQGLGATDGKNPMVKIYTDPRDARAARDPDCGGRR